MIKLLAYNFANDLKPINRSISGEASRAVISGSLRFGDLAIIVRK